MGGLTAIYAGAGTGRATEAALVVCDNGPLRAIECVDDMRVTARVLAQAVNDDDKTVGIGHR